MYLHDFFSLFSGVQSAPELGPTCYETPCVCIYIYIYNIASYNWTGISTIIMILLYYILFKNNMKVYLSFLFSGKKNSIK